MAFCKNCGTELGEDWKFCKECGTPVEKESAAEDVKKEEEQIEEAIEEKKEANGNAEELNNKAETEEENSVNEEPIEEKESVDTIIIDENPKTSEKKSEASFKERIKEKWKKISLFYKMVIVSSIITAFLLLCALNNKEILPLLISIVQGIGIVSAILIDKGKIKVSKKWIKNLIVIVVLMFSIINIKSYDIGKKNNYTIPVERTIGEKKTSVNTPYAATECSQRKYEEVKKDFESVGFTNISGDVVYDLEKENSEKAGKVESVSINGISDFGANKEFKANSKIIIRYHSYKKIKIPFSSETVKTTKIEDVLKELENAGFININAEEKFDIDPDVDKSEFKNSISIDGVDTFEKDTEFPIDATINVINHKPYSKYSVKIEIDFIPNILFDKYNVEFEFNGEKYNINHGEDKKYEFRVEQGKYKGTFVSSASSSVKGSFELNVIGDTNAKYIMNCYADAINIREEYVENKGAIKENEAMVPNSYIECWFKDYKDIEERFRTSGFTNISSEQVKDIYFGITSEGEVSKVSIDGKTDFERGEIFPKDAKVVITYHMKAESSEPTSSEQTSTPSVPQQEASNKPNPQPLDVSGKIHSPMTSLEAKYKNYKDVENSFRAAGFTNVTFEKIGDITPTSVWNKDGEVKEISIDGKTSYSKTDSFDPGVGVVIKYHTTPEYIPVTVAVMIKEKNDNAASAKDKYEGKFYEISGILSNIDSDLSYITIGANKNSFDTVLCRIKDNQTKEVVKTLKNGQNIRVKCQVTDVGEVLGYTANITEIVK